MGEKIKSVNGNLIKIMSREEINKELIEKGDWGIEYYVPGRILNPYFITVNRKKYRFDKLEEIENFCRKYKKTELIRKDEFEINDLIRSM